MKSSRSLAWLVLFAAVIAVTWGAMRSATAPGPLIDEAVPAAADSPPAPPSHVGATVCAGCHADEFAAWQDSHHALAMQYANASTVLGDFDNATFSDGSVTTTFSTRNGRFYVNTDAADGTLQDFEIRYTFGVFPLQQYLVAFPDGRVQALGIAWDSRPRTEGGQRWFHLHPDERIDHNDELHWTRIAQNWNHMCAECHSTDVRKRYSLADDSFDTSFAEMNVACEACHGPGSAHVAWARQEPGTAGVVDKGLAIRLDERRGVRWTMPPGASIATRSVPRDGVREIEMCARCHSRRSMLSEDYRHGRPLMDTHLPALLTPPQYHPDGQIRDEDFEYGSFLQSRMFHAGVTCSDCHEPHGGKLRAPGNATCLLCHQAATYDTGAHHFHRVYGKGGQCTACHMPTTNFMVVHARHDHSIRIPRPDLSVRIGSPNACTQCHADRKSAWAEQQLRTWYGEDWSPGWHFGEALHDAARGAPQAGTDLAAVSLSPQVPDIARATAAAVLADHLDPTALAVLPKLLADDSAMVRHAALASVEALPPERRWGLAGHLLRDPVLAVRIEAARVLAGVSASAPTAALRSAFDAALREYIAVAMASAEHPQSHVNLGLLYQVLGDPVRSEAAYRQALALDRRYVPAWVNLADLFRAAQKDEAVEETLLQARTACGERAAIAHALGLHYVRMRQMSNALESLATAARLEPDNARYGYVLAVALDSGGQAAAALAQLERVHVAHPEDRDVLVALVSFNLARGNQDAARQYAARLVAIDPRHGSVDDVLRGLASQ